MKSENKGAKSKVGNVVKVVVVTILIAGMLASTFAGLFYAIEAL
jgi:hypothetical protein